MSEEPSYSPRDAAYLSSPGFESYIVAGFAFILTFTAFFVFGVLTKQQALAWPGLLLGGLLCFVTLKILQRREYSAKVREIAEEQASGKAESGRAENMNAEHERGT